MVGKRRYQRHFIFLTILLLGGMLTYCNQKEETITREFIVERMYSPRSANESVLLVLDWEEVAKQFEGYQKTDFTLTDLNFGKTVPVQLVDTNSDQTPEQLVNEPIFAFALSTGKGLSSYRTERTSVDNRLKLTWLTSYTDYVKTSSIPSLSDKIIQSTMQVYPDPVQLALYAPNRWNYEYGFFLNAVFEQWERTKNEAYLNYCKQWVDHFIDENGKLDSIHYKPLEYKLDDILPGRLFISLYEVTKEEKYKNAANQLKDHLHSQPKTSEGGYWHKQIYPSQMWLDGIYMGDLFSLQYGHTFDSAQWIKEAIHQIELIAKHTTDSTTGLLYHGWDESKNDVWAHPERGTSPEFWGRAIGWYIMALVESLEYIPTDHPKRAHVEELFKSLAASVLKYQDKDSKLWYQVVDKGEVSGNWIETSCSAMFTYAFAKGHRLGLLDSTYYTAAQNAFHSLLQSYVAFDDVGILYLNRTVKIGTLNPKTSKGDFDYYITTECRINDYKGLAALLYSSIELEKTLAKN
jgi:unsaturated rhamnogalacturonyl hydrolase